MIENDRGKDFYNSIFQNFITNIKIEHYFRNTDKGAVFAERFNKSIKSPLRKPFFEKGDGNWIDVLPTKTKQYNNRIRTSSEITPIQASLKKNEGLVSKSFLDKRKKVEPKFQVNSLVRIADIKRLFSKRDTTKWSHILYKITEIINDTIQSYRIDNLKERHNEALLKKERVITERER